MPAYVIANVHVEDAEAYEEYRRVVPAIIERFGGRYLARAGRADVLEGGLTAGRVIVLEFPSYAEARRWYESPEYEAVKGIRRGCSTGDVIIVEGV
jgi:uncharacterized protein (DUF1330 family)